MSLRATQKVMNGVHALLKKSVSMCTRLNSEHTHWQRRAPDTLARSPVTRHVRGSRILSEGLALAVLVQLPVKISGQLQDESEMNQAMGTR